MALIIITAKKAIVRVIRRVVAVSKPLRCRIREYVAKVFLFSLAPARIFADGSHGRLLRFAATGFTDRLH